LILTQLIRERYKKGEQIYAREIFSRKSVFACEIARISYRAFVTESLFVPNDDESIQENILWNNTQNCTLQYSQFRASCASSCDDSFVNKEFLQYHLSATINAKDRKTQSISFFDPITLAFIISERRYCKNFLLFQTVEPCAEFDKVQKRQR